jgi:hypothetical protein
VDSPEAPPGFPASEQTEWVKFWGGDVNISRYLPAQGRKSFISRLLAAYRDSEIGKPFNQRLQ